MFAMLGLGLGELLVLGVLGAGLAAVVLMLAVLAVARGSTRAKQAADEGRQLRIEMDRLREENQQLREEVKRLRGGQIASTDTGVKQA